MSQSNMLIADSKGHKKASDLDLHVLIVAS